MSYNVLYLIVSEETIHHPTSIGAISIWKTKSPRHTDVTFAITILKNRMIYDDGGDNNITTSDSSSDNIRPR